MDEHIPRGLRIVYMNTRSMSGKLTDIMECFKGTIDIFCMNESWLNDNIEDDNVRWIGNRIFRIDRTANRSGGLATYICNDLASHTTTVEGRTYIKEYIEIQTLLKGLIHQRLCIRPSGQSVAKPDGSRRMGSVEAVSVRPGGWTDVVCRSKVASTDPPSVPLRLGYETVLD